MASYREYSERSRRRRRRQRLGYFLIFLILLVLILGVAYLVVKVADILYPQNQPLEDFTPVDTLAEVVEELDPDFITVESGSGEPGVQRVTEEGPIQLTIDAMALTNPDHRMMALPENGRVDMSYFDDVTFLGDSLTQGIAIYNDNTFPNSDLAAWKGCSPMTLVTNVMAQPDGTAVDAVEFIAGTAPDKIYILLGSNALVSQSDEVFLKYYEQLLDKIGARLPGVRIYVMAIPTATREETAARAAKGQDFSVERIGRLNDVLAKMVYIRSLYFINLQEALCTDEGYLNPEYDGGDGLHLNAAGYRAWRDYLISHTAHRADNPYLLGSPYYDPAANEAWLNSFAAPMAPADADAAVGESVGEGADGADAAAGEPAGGDDAAGAPA